MSSSEDALLAVSQMQREALDPQPLIDALKNLYRSDKKLAMEAVTGRCEWRDDYDSSLLEELSMQAENMAFDVEQERFSPSAIPSAMRKPTRTYRIASLYAAAAVLGEIATDREQDERIARWQADDMGCRAPKPYLQREFI